MGPKLIGVYITQLSTPIHAKPIVSPYLDSQVAGNNSPLSPKVDHSGFKVAHNSEPLALQVGPLFHFPLLASCNKKHNAPDHEVVSVGAET